MPRHESSAADPRPRWVIFAVGNPSRGDDALGPLLLERLEAWLEEDGRAAALPVAVTLLTDFQLQIEHALDLVGAEVALFVDASADPADAPCSLRPLQAEFDVSHSTHALSAACVLAVAERLGLGQRLPTAWRAAIAGEAFVLGAPLTETARRHLDTATIRFKTILNAGVIVEGEDFSP